MESATTTDTKSDMDSAADSVVERLLRAAQMSQEPKDRIWTIIIVLALMIFALGGFLLDIRLFLTEERSLAYERAAADCLELIVDDDRDFEMPSLCEDSQVVIHYPPTICSGYFATASRCGDEWEE